MSRSLADAPPSTRTSRRRVPVSASIASRTSATWKAMPSSVARAQMRRGGAARQPQDRSARRRVPLRRAEPRERGHDDDACRVGHRCRERVDFGRRPRSRASRRAATGWPRRRRRRCLRAHSSADRSRSATRRSREGGGGSPRAAFRYASAEGAGAVGALDEARARAELPEQGRLLIAEHAGDRNRTAEHAGVRLGDPPGAWHDLGQDRGGDAEQRDTASRPNAPVRMFMSIVREALLTSVTCFRPPVSFQRSHASIVPAASRPSAARRRASGTCSRSHRSFEPEKYGSSRSPVRRRMARSAPALLILSIRGAVRRSCQTIALCTAWPVARSQRTTVSRWFVMPIAARPPALTPAAFNASRAVSCVDSQISSGSCSTQPGCGKCWANSRCAAPRLRPRPSRTMARELDVPWSRARTYGTFQSLPKGKRCLSEAARR